MSNLKLKSTALQSLVELSRSKNPKDDPDDSYVTRRIGHNTNAYVYRETPNSTLWFASVEYHRSTIARLWAFKEPFKLTDAPSSRLATKGTKYSHIDWIEIELDAMAEFTDAGYGTPTTRNRLNIIAHDNGIPIRFTQRNHAQIATGSSETLNPNSEPFQNLWDGQYSNYVILVRVAGTNDWIKVIYND